MTNEPGDPDPSRAALPGACAGWRGNPLGPSADAPERRLLPDRIGPVRGLRVPDAGCGDGALAGAGVLPTGFALRCAGAGPDWRTGRVRAETGA